MSDSKAGYDVFKGLVSGKQVNTLSSVLTQECLQAKSIAALQDSEYIYVLHDPCDIRKSHSQKMEGIGQVLDLSKKVVNGYKSMNSVAVDAQKREVNLLYHHLYSTQSANYLPEATIGNIQTYRQSPESAAGVKAGQQYGKEQEALYDKGDYINTGRAYLQAVKESGQLLKQGIEGVKVCHVSDREFDGEKYFEAIDGQGDHFISRLKLSRLSNEQRAVYTPKGKASKKKAFKKLVDKPFESRESYQIACLTIKSKTYRQVDCRLEWEPLELNQKQYWAVRITLLQAGRPIFDQPMLLLTNRPVKNVHQAKQVYQGYILRFKIEVVFRFMKQDLGWETFQARDFESIKNLLAIVFFLVGYFKELEEELKTHPLAQFLCQLAKSKGKVTMHFMLKGIEKLVFFQETKNWMEQNNISEMDVQEFLSQLKS